ncbi:MAG: hypothetical protein Fur0035_17450 [Anaerolineales bacterium]
MNTFLYTGTDEGVNKLQRLKEKGWLELLERAAQDAPRPAWYEPLLLRLGDALIAAGTKLKTRKTARREALAL